MTGQQSLQFVEHLRQARHLKSIDADNVVDAAAFDPHQGHRHTPQSAWTGKLWELTDLSASEFADEAARPGERRAGGARGQ